MENRSRQRTGEQPRVLVVEDDESHLIALSLGLEREGFAVTTVSDGREVLRVVREISPTVILLDVMLPGRSGIDVCRDLRSFDTETPVIMVSARNDEVDVVVGIEVGADDYLAKPYRMRELVARIGALLRRSSVPHPGASPEPRLPDLSRVPVDRGVEDEILVVGDVRLDPHRHEVFVGDREIHLPLRQFQLLAQFLENPGRLLTKDVLLERVWGYDYEGDARIIATVVGRLRAQLEQDPHEPTRIVTVRGLGYRYNRP
jgi:two-component system response regulator RegX3